MKMLFVQRQQLGIYVIAGSILFAFVLFRYMPLRRKILAIEQVKNGQKLVIAKGVADGKQLPLIEEQLLKLKSDLGDYEASIPNQRDLGGFLHRIADLMKEHSLTDQVITPGKEVEAEEFICIPVSMQCDGELSRISEFYRRLQALDRLVRIEQVKFTNDNSYSGQVSMETDVVVYYKAGIGQG
ncbi:MAG: type 4a pilus biogenesis protein PilO [Desulfobacteraceae bacterium]|nr:type 4a pilus biogenesis protein PilO [Desulfobacteraceae bacterium]